MKKGVAFVYTNLDAAEMFRLIKAKRRQKFARTTKEENIISGGVLMGLRRRKIQIQYSYQIILLTT